MPKIPILPPRIIIKALKQIGFRKVRQKGTHIVLQKAEKSKTLTVVIPNHKEITKGTLKSILRQANIDLKHFLKILSILLIE